MPRTNNNGGNNTDVDDKINWERRRERKLKREHIGYLSRSSRRQIFSIYIPIYILFNSKYLKY